MWVVVLWTSQWLEDGDEGIVGPFLTEEEAKAYAQKHGEYAEVVKLKEISEQ